MRRKKSSVKQAAQPSKLFHTQGCSKLSQTWWGQCIGLLLHQGYLECKVALQEISNCGFKPVELPPDGIAATSDDDVPHRQASPQAAASQAAPLVPASDQARWDFRAWGQDGMGAWQQGVSPADAGPSKADHERVNLRNRREKLSQSSSQFEQVEWKVPVAGKKKKKCLASICAVAITAKGLQFLNSRTSLQTLLPR